MQHTLSYYHGGGGFIVKRPWYVFCCRSDRATERPSAAAKSAAAIAGRERGMVAMAMTFVTGRKEYGQNYGQGKLIMGNTPNHRQKIKSANNIKCFLRFSIAKIKAKFKKDCHKKNSIHGSSM
jgi:hypothetical protein